jgi:hypothetical protein
MKKTRISRFSGTLTNLCLLQSLLFFTLISPLYAQVGTLLSSQAQVDAFTYERLDGRLTISGNDISNLDSLYRLYSVTSLAIENNPNLSNIDGLTRLSFTYDLMVGPSELSIKNNPALVNIDALSGITPKSVPLGDPYNQVSIVIDGNAALLNVDGLLGVTGINLRLAITNNASLAHVDGLSFMEWVGDSSIIKNNASLTDCCGLYRLISNGYLTDSLYNNGTGCTPADILAAGPCEGVCLKDTVLASQAQVDSFSCKKISGNLTISGSDITHLDSLFGLTAIGGDLIISNNPGLTDLDGLSELPSIGRDLDISG